MTTEPLRPPSARHGTDGRSVLIREFLATICEIHQRDATSDLARVYEATLSDLAIQNLDRALALTLKNVKFWPTPAHVREQHERRFEFAAASAWRLAFDRLRRCHYDPAIQNGPWVPTFTGTRPPEDYLGRVEPYGSGFLVWPPDPDPSIEAAVEAVGGWQRLKDLGTHEHDFVRRDFVKAFENAARREIQSGTETSLLDQMPADLVQGALKEMPK